MPSAIRTLSLSAFVISGVPSASPNHFVGEALPVEDVTTAVEREHDHDRALPLFWDQYDNAQRVDETGFGIRLATYEFDDAELLGAIDRLLADDALAARMAGIAAAAQAAPGTVRAAGLVEQLVREPARA